ncbi:MAG: DNA repair protein RadC [bacterium]|nr:DNA repair protein RadC [bacterium]
MTHEQLELPLFDVHDPDTEREKTRREEQGIVEHALCILTRWHKPGAVISSPEQTKDFLRIKLADERHEVFGCIFLDNRHRVIAVEDLFFGTIDGAFVFPRVIVQKALAHNAAAIVAYHNHPSGVAEPSTADMQITRRIKEALALVDIRLIDHLVVCVGECTSFAERSLL